MAAMMRNKTRIEDREIALATCLASKKRLNTELDILKENLATVREGPVIDSTEVRRLSSEIAKLSRDLQSEEQYEKEKFEEIRILKMKHYDLQQQFAEQQMGSRIYKFPSLERT